MEPQVGCVMSGKIFINYRRGDEPGFTHALFGQLEQSFPKDRLFMDVDSISPGVDFVHEIEDQVSKCKILLAVIGPDWLNFADENTGERRLDNKNDYVRIEIEAALNRDIRVIPVLINGAEMPVEADLPTGLKLLARRNAIRISHDRFRSDVQRLTSSIQEVLGEVTPPKLTPIPRPSLLSARILGLLGFIGLIVALSGLFYAWDKNWRYQLLGTYEGKSGYVKTIDITSNGRRAVTAGYDPQVWEINSLRRVRKLANSHATLLNTVALSYDDKFLATGGCKAYDKKKGRCTQGEIKYWDISSGSQVGSIYAHTGYINTIIYLPHGNMLSGGCDEYDDRNACTRAYLKLWNVITGELIRKFEHDSFISSVAVSPDGKKAITGSSDSQVRMWDLLSGGPLRTYDAHRGGVNSVAYSPDGKSFISGGGDNTVKLWQEKFVDAEVIYKGHKDKVLSVAFSPDGQIIASGGQDGTVRLWDKQSGRLIHTLEGHRKQVTVVKFTPDGQKVLSGSWDKTIKIWDVRSLKQRLGF